MMNKINELEEALTIEIELSETLLQVLQQKQDAVVRHDLERLNDCIEREQGLLPPLAAVNGERVRLNRELLAAYSAAPVNPNDNDRMLERLMQHVSPDDVTRLSGLMQKLRSVAHEVLMTNAMNMRIIEFSLNLVRKNITMIQETFSHKLVDQKA